LREKAANNGQDESKSLSEELGIQDPRSLNVSLECSMCQMRSSIDIDMKDHKISNHCAFHMKQVLKRKIMDFGKENTKKRMNLKSSILKMKEKELKENVFCKCKSFCRIFHSKHNWQKNPSEEFESKLEAIYSENLEILKS
jgi:hypothetical protein